MNALSRLFRKAVFPAVFFFASPAFAQTAPGEIFTRKGQADLALSWLRALFRGENLDGLQAGAAFAQITDSVRHVLGLYSVGMLVLAGFLLLYYALTLVAQTAHTGRIEWTKKNKLWAPLRFALVMALLVPVGGGLNLGQFAIVKLAEQGSALASNAWQSAAERMKDSFAGLVTPRPPDLRPVATRAVEMALCRSIYRHYYDAFQPDEPLSLAGEINELQRVPAERLSEENWRYANRLHDDPPLCGAYRFLAPSSAMIGAASTAAPAALDADPTLPVLGDSARAAADRLALQADAFAEDVVGAFIQSQTITAEPAAGPVFARFLKDQQSLLNARIASLVRDKMKAENRQLADSAESGWVGAGWLLLDLMNRQSVLGDLAVAAVPAIDPPILGHEILAYQHVQEKVENDPKLRAIPEANLAKLYAFYDKAQSAMKRARNWLYRAQLDNPELVLPAAWDAADALPSGSDSEKSFAVFRRLLDAGFTSYGVWGRAGASEDKNLSNPTLSDDMRRNPMGALAEMGRRYVSLGAWTMGAVGRFLFEPSAATGAALYLMLGAAIALAGLGLLFLVPLLPMFRFVAAVLTWILLVFESVASVPLVALAHMSPSGEGLAADTARHAFALWLSVFIRPFLILFGFLVGWAGFFLGVLFLNAGFASLAETLSLVQTGSLTGLRVLLTVLYAVFVVAAANVSFKGISFFPDRATEWLGNAIQGAGASAQASAESAVAGAPQTGDQAAASHTETHERTAAASSHRETHRTREGRAAPSPLSRENQLFPQFKEKEVPDLMVRTEGAQAFASTSSEANALSGARSEKEGAVAIATAKASLHIGPGGENALSELAKEAREIILGEGEEKKKLPLSDEEEGDGKADEKDETKREESRPHMTVEIEEEEKK